MAATTLSTDVQLRYLLQWFSEWSELQRSDFVPILADHIGTSKSSLYMNGVVSTLAGVSCEERPMNLFQCRVKLFRAWTSNWSKEQMNRLVEKFTEIDSSFGEKLNEELNPKSGKDEKSEDAALSVNLEANDISPVEIQENNSGLDNADKRELVEA